jgi:3'-phosphoadenosine 5'-phosphosulfate sulfotransferase (PAPS reductase)/FAD synthetase
MNLDTFFSRHDRVALMFSGGRDSIACLHLVKPYMDKVTVVWANTGANFPEIESYMDVVRSQVPRFLEVFTDQAKSIEANGYPTDVLPISYVQFGQLLTSPKPIKLRASYDCCAENFWNPVEAKIRELGMTGVIRGQRADEFYRSPVVSGHVYNGVEYVFPISDWSSEDVLSYLREQGEEITERLQMAHSSLDCWNCTAFLSGSEDRMKYVKKHYPEKYEKVVHIFKQIDNAVTSEMAGLHKILEY